MDLMPSKSITWLGIPRESESEAGPPPTRIKQKILDTNIANNAFSHAPYFGNELLQIDNDTTTLKAGMNPGFW